MRATGDPSGSPWIYFIFFRCNVRRPYLFLWIYSANDSSSPASAIYENIILDRDLGTISNWIQQGTVWHRKPWDQISFLLSPMQLLISFVIDIFFVSFHRMTRFSATCVASSSADLQLLSAVVVVFRRGGGPAIYGGSKNHDFGQKFATFW